MTGSPCETSTLLDRQTRAQASAPRAVAPGRSLPGATTAGRAAGLRCRRRGWRPPARSRRAPGSSRRPRWTGRSAAPRCRPGADHPVGRRPDAARPTLGSRPERGSPRGGGRRTGEPPRSALRACQKIVVKTCTGTAAALHVAIERLPETCRLRIARQARAGRSARSRRALRSRRSRPRHATPRSTPSSARAPPRSERPS